MHKGPDAGLAPGCRATGRPLGTLVVAMSRPDRGRAIRSGQAGAASSTPPEPGALAESPGAAARNPNSLSTPGLKKRGPGIPGP